MNQQLLDIVAKGILQLVGLGPEEIKMQVNQRTLQNQKIPKTPSIPKAQLPPAGQPTPAAGPDIPERPSSSTDTKPNKFRNTKPTRPATGFTRQQPNSSKLRLDDRVARAFTGKNADQLTRRNMLNILSGGIFNQGAQLADLMLNALGTSVVEETFGSGRVMEDFQQSLNRQKNNKPTTQPLPSYSGMEDMSGDPIKPTRKPVDVSGSPNATSLSVQPYNGSSSSAPAPSAPPRPDYSNMTELERLKIWATTNRKMIESVGTSKQRGILKEALGIRPLSGRQI